MDSEALKEQLSLLNEELAEIDRANHTIAHALTRLDIEYRKFRSDVEKTIQTIMLAAQESRQAKIKIEDIRLEIEDIEKGERDDTHRNNNDV